MDRLLYEVPDELVQILREYATLSAERAHHQIQMTDPPAQDVIDELGEDQALEFGEHMDTLKNMNHSMFSCVYTFGFLDGFIYAHKTLGLNSLIANLLRYAHEEEQEKPSPKLKFPKAGTEKTPESVQDFLQMLGVDSILDKDDNDGEED